MLGLPADADGFVPVDAHSRVEGLEDVYVAGDGADYPVKQGGLATQQADAAAEAIAAALGVPCVPAPFDPVLRGVLLTGSRPVYLRASLGDSEVPPDVAGRALWWPPGKIAGRYLSPYLGGFAQHDHDAALDMALRAADDEARGGSEWTALEWLQVAERLGGALPPQYVTKRRRWQLVRRPEA
jgi:sulfide:quinone oxidoreductase